MYFLVIKIIVFHNNTGNVARKLLHDTHVRAELLSQVPEHRRENLARIISKFSVVIRVLSSKQQIENLQIFKQYCLDLYKFIVTTYPPPQCYLSPTFHNILEHGWELIEKNDGRWFGMLSEAGIEASNKILRRFRISLSRKCDQITNLSDCMIRLFTRSDPVLNNIRYEVLPRCKVCCSIGHAKKECPKTIRVLNEEDTTQP